MRTRFGERCAFAHFDDTARRERHPPEILSVNAGQRFQF
jgi:hypothetical protein